MVSDAVDSKPPLSAAWVVVCYTVAAALVAAGLAYIEIGRPKPSFPASLIDGVIRVLALACVPGSAVLRGVGRRRPTPRGGFPGCRFVLP